MESIPGLGLFISLILFLACAISAFGNKQGIAFLGLTALSLVVASLATWCVLCSVFGNHHGGGWSIIIYGILIGPFLPGVASILALALLGPRSSGAT